MKRVEDMTLEELTRAELESRERERRRKASARAAAERERMARAASERWIREHNCILPDN